MSIAIFKANVSGTNHKNIGFFGGSPVTMSCSLGHIGHNIGMRTFFIFINFYMKIDFILHKRLKYLPLNPT